MNHAINDCLKTLRQITGQPPKKSGNEWVSFCPIHEADGKGHKPSLTLREGDRQGVIVNCHAGCDHRDLLKVLGVEPSASPSKEPVIYSYRDQTGGEVRQKVRFEPKDFRIRHQGAAGEWVYKAGAGPAVLYRLPELKAAITEGRTVFLCEGEKDVDRLTALGLCATTNIEGAAQPNQRAKWRNEYTEQLADAARVILLPDNDAPGRAHMAHIAQQLAGKAADVRTLVLPDLPEKGDVSDWLAQGHTQAELEALAAQATAPTNPYRGTDDANADLLLTIDSSMAHLFHTDLGNSERLVARHGVDIRYCFDFGKWLIWDGVRWAIDRDGVALEKAKDTARKMLAEASTLTDREDSRKLAAWSFRSQARDRLAAMLYLAQPDVSVRPERLDTHPWLLNVQNGTIDLRTGQLTQPNRDDLMTKLSPVTYDPTAVCSQWLAFINRIFDGDAEVIRYVQKAAGYSLTGLDVEECFFVLHGTGSNGKSTFVETLSALLGTDYAQQATPDLLMLKKQERHATELAVLRGARLVASVETGQGKRLNEVLIKSMTGGDRIRANFMHQDTFEFRPEFKVWLSTNHKPVITGTDLGIWRRIRLIPFTVQIPDKERDGAFKTRLREPEALSGILNWALEGVLLWQKEGLRPPAAVTDAIQAYREEMDVLAAWISECCVVKKLAEASAADLYRSYVQWREQNGERPETQTSFGLRLTERGFERIKRRNGIFWLGIGLLVREQCEQCEPISDIKEPNSGNGFRNVENGFTPFTPFTQAPDISILSHHLGRSPPVETFQRDQRCLNDL